MSFVRNIFGSTVPAIVKPRATRQRYLVKIQGTSEFIFRQAHNAVIALGETIEWCILAVLLPKLGAKATRVVKD